ncbi:SEC4 [Oopsacas minuta]|uniref:SEC4 n=1 Tax=Oopsacas minuta TaxID=111878 RepID=A0AAV7KJV3_9METZ|nr:SEC4 [Oopsacas minuta]
MALKENGNAFMEDIFKVLLVGDLSAGKTSLMLRFTEAKFNPKQSSTVGIDYKCKRLFIGDDNYKLQVWDTAGQERFRTLTNAYYRGANESVRQNAPVNAKVMIVGCKSDLEEDREVSRSNGEELSKAIEAQFYECSAQTGENCDEIFIEIMQEIKRNRTSTKDRQDPHYYQKIHEHGVKNSGCCQN